MKSLIDKIKKIDGFLLGINIKEKKVKNAISLNDKIYKCDLLENMESKENSIENVTSIKTIQIRKLGKQYRKKKVDYFLCNMDGIEKYMPYIWKDAFLISKKEICFYGTLEKEDITTFLQKCRRYQGKVEVKKEEKNTFFYLESRSVPRYKSYFYFFLDEINLFFDKIAYFLEK